MALETRICECGQEFETSEWVATRECPECQDPHRGRAPLDLLNLTLEQLRTLSPSNTWTDPTTGYTYWGQVGTPTTVPITYYTYNYNINQQENNG